MLEEQLIQQAQEGCDNSFSKLVFSYQNRLYHYLLARCHNSYDADDILQDTFINAFKYLHSYKSKWKFSTWLFTIANRLLSKQKKFYKQYNDLSDIDVTVELEEIDIDRNNLWIKIKTIVKQDAYDVLWLFYVEEFSIKEIAEILQRSSSWVKISLHRSKKKLLINKDIIILSNDYLIKV